MANKFTTNKQKELILNILPNLSVEKIEQLILLLLEENYEEIKKLLKDQKKEKIDKILSITKKDLKEESHDKNKETETEHFTKEGHKKIDALEKKISESEKITKDNFYKHPAHFKYVAYLLNQIEDKYHDSKLRLRLRKSFLGEQEDSATTYHKVKMFKEYSAQKDKSLEQYLKEKPNMLRNDFSDEDLIKISNSIVSTLRDYYYGEFIGLKNYNDYVIKNEDSDNEKRKKARKLRFLDAAITSQHGEFGATNEQIFRSLKQMQEQKMPFGSKTMLDQIDEHIFSPAIEHHKRVTRDRILNTFLTHKNFGQFQHYLNDYLAQNPDIPKTHQENLRKLYQDRNLDNAKNIFGQLMSKGMGNYPIAEKTQFEIMKKMYSEHNQEEKDKYKQYITENINDESKKYSAHNSRKTKK